VFEIGMISESIFETINALKY